MAHMGSFSVPQSFTYNAYLPVSNAFQHSQPFPFSRNFAFPGPNSRSAMMAQHKIMNGKESKPRLNKDEVEKLENEFRKNPKPTSQVKRELATQMDVPLPRINNWFQNRRAKAKQEKKQEEYNQRLTGTSGGESGDSDVDDSSPDTEHLVEYYPMSNTEQPLGPSTAPFPQDSIAPAAPNSPSQFIPQLDGTLPTALDTSDAMLQSESTSDELTSPYSSPVSLALQSNASPVFTMPMMTQPFMAPASQDGFAMMLPDAPAPFVHESPVDLARRMSGSISSAVGPTDVDAFGMPLAVANAMPDKFPSELLVQGKLENQDMLGEALSPGTSGPDGHPSPLTILQSPPAISEPGFKSPPPVDLASRRGRRPAPITLRNNSFTYGPKTGIEMPSRMDGGSPMRRVASATGGLPCRIQKPIGFGPRSPMFSDRSKDAILHSLQGAGRSPSVGGLPMGASVAPPTPSTPLLVNHPHHQHQRAREGTASSSSSSDHDPAFLMTTFPVMDHGVKTPPGTPGFMPHFRDMVFTTPADMGFGYNPQDEPLLTPGLASFPSEPDFSMATSAAFAAAATCASQPVTPSFPPQSMGPGFYHPMTAGAAEYHWASDYPIASAKSSPGQPKSKQYQFTQNVTPDDFTNAADK